MTNPENNTETILDEVVRGIYARYPDLLTKYGEAGKRKCREDNQHHMDHLETAFQIGNAAVFTDYANWLNDVLTSRGMKTEHLTDNFNQLHEAIKNKWKNDREEFYKETLQQAVKSLETNHGFSERSDG